MDNIRVKEVDLASNFHDLIDVVMESYDNEKFELLEALDSVASELERYPGECFAHVIKAMRKTGEALSEEGICPECGGNLITVTDKSRETYVPYGEGYVSLGDGYRTECERCGYKVED